MMVLSAMELIRGLPAKNGHGISALHLMFLLYSWPLCTGHRIESFTSFVSVFREDPRWGGGGDKTVLKY